MCIVNYFYLLIFLQLSCDFDSNFKYGAELLDRLMKVSTCTCTCTFYYLLLMIPAPFNFYCLSKKAKFFIEARLLQATNTAILLPEICNF